MRYLFPTPIVDNVVRVSSGQRVPYDDLPASDPARSIELRPQQAGYFTGRPGFYHQLLELEMMLEHLNTVPAAAPPGGAAVPRPLSQVTWLKKDEMATKLGVPLAINEYRGLVGLLQTLWTHPNGFLVLEDLHAFLRPASQKTVVTRESSLDALGRAYATGRRKASVARVWVWPAVPGSGPAQIRVNRAPLAAAFSRPHDRYGRARGGRGGRGGHAVVRSHPAPPARLAVTEPLRLLDLSTTHHVMCTVKGGGPTGQVGGGACGACGARPRGLNDPFATGRRDPPGHQPRAGEAQRRVAPAAAQGGPAHARPACR